MNSPAIRFTGQVEYALDGDFAKIGAHLNVDAPEQIANESLSLQLWACDDHFDPTAPQNTRIASLPLQPQLYSGFYSDQTPALPPAGNRDYLIAMALVGETDGGNTRVHDVALFNNRQLFTQPRIQGFVGSQILDGCVELRIESIINPRDEQNLSGSLNLELWAMNTPYSGAAFSGFQLASCELGALNGGSEWRDNLFTLNMVQPPAGEWTLVLMLREWSSAGYVTRDYRELPTLIQQPQAAEAEAEVEQEALTQAEVMPAEPAKVIEAKPATVKSDTIQQEKTAGKVKEKQAAAPVRKKSAAKASKAKPQSKKPDSKASTAPVSINKADIDALAAVKGLSPRLAKAIIAERPYESLDQLTKARGLGEKTVAKIKKYLSL